GRVGHRRTPFRQNGHPMLGGHFALYGKLRESEPCRTRMSVARDVTMTPAPAAVSVKDARRAPSGPPQAAVPRAHRAVMVLRPAATVTAVKVATRSVRVLLLVVMVLRLVVMVLRLVVMVLRLAAIVIAVK